MVDAQTATKLPCGLASGPNPLFSPPTPPRCGSIKCSRHSVRKAAREDWSARPEEAGRFSGLRLRVARCASVRRREGARSGWRAGTRLQ